MTTDSRNRILTTGMIDSNLLDLIFQVKRLSPLIPCLVLVNFVESITNKDVDELVVDVVAGGDVVQILKFLDSGQDRKAGEVRLASQ